jgi:predicted component of type VI protein secretion system
MQLSITVRLDDAVKATRRVRLPCVIGRSRDADLTIGHPMFSRKHCQLYEEDGTLMLRDLGSLNGTYYRGEMIGESELPPEAAFSIGGVQFQVEILSDRRQPTSPPPVDDDPQRRNAPDGNGLVEPVEDVSPPHSGEAVLAPENAENPPPTPPPPPPESTDGDNDPFGQDSSVILLTDDDIVEDDDLIIEAEPIDEAEAADDASPPPPPDAEPRKKDDLSKNDLDDLFEGL